VSKSPKARHVSVVTLGIRRRWPADDLGRGGHQLSQAPDSVEAACRLVTLSRACLGGVSYKRRPTPGNAGPKPSSVGPAVRRATHNLLRRQNRMRATMIAGGAAPETTAPRKGPHWGARGLPSLRPHWTKRYRPPTLENLASESIFRTT
jgi:hypothetical protein